MDKDFSIALGLVILAVVVGVAYYLRFSRGGVTPFGTPTVTPVTTEQPIASPTANPRAKDGCVIGGCSGEICSDRQIVSSCIYKPEVACYKNAACEKQSNGKCGWTQTKELAACLSKERNSAAPPVF